MNSPLWSYSHVTQAACFCLHQPDIESKEDLSLFGQAELWFADDLPPVSFQLYLVLSRIGGPLNIDPKCYNLSCRDPQKGSPNFGKLPF